MTINIKFTKQKLEEKIEKFFNNFSCNEFILNLARYREEKYFEKSIDYHFDYEVKLYQKLLNKDSELGFKITNFMENMNKNKSVIITRFKNIKENYEIFFEKKYFINLDKLTIVYEKNNNVEQVREVFKEKAIIYSILNMNDMIKIKKESIQYGQYVNFCHLFFKKIEDEILLKNIKLEVIRENYYSSQESDFIYSFKKYFQSDVTINPYYRPISERGEIVGEFTDRAVGTIKKIFFDNYAKKNGIVNISQKSIEEVTDKFQFYWRKDKLANNKILNNYFISEISKKTLKYINHYESQEELFEKIAIQYENYLNSYVIKYPKNFIENVVEYIQKEKINNFQLIKECLKTEKAYLDNEQKIESEIVSLINYNKENKLKI